jgi:hypothetical protein
MKEPTMFRVIALFTFSTILLALVIAGCGGTGLGTPGTPQTPEQHRPSAQPCPSHTGDKCTVDSDCASGGVCSCAGSTRGWAGSSPNNVCVPANCHIDADCSGGHACSPTVSTTCGPFYGVQGYYCHTSGDECVNDSDCKAQPTGYCAYAPEVGHWSCHYTLCAG